MVQSCRSAVFRVGKQRPEPLRCHATLASHARWEKGGAPMHLAGALAYYSQKLSIGVNGGCTESGVCCPAQTVWSKYRSWRSGDGVASSRLKREASSSINCRAAGEGGRAGAGPDLCVKKLVAVMSKSSHASVASGFLEITPVLGLHHLLVPWQRRFRPPQRTFVGPGLPFSAGVQIQHPRPLG